MKSTFPRKGGAWQRVALAGAALFALVACASTPPPPLASLQSARQAISQAEQSRAAEHAALELAQARDKLAAADNAVDEENMREAQQLAEESRVLAELALARSELGEARNVNQEIVQGTEVLREEMRRNERGTGGAR